MAAKGGHVSGFGFRHAFSVRCTWGELSCDSLSTVYIQELPPDGLLSLRSATGCHQYHVLWHLHSGCRWRLRRGTIRNVQKWNRKPGSPGGQQRTAGAKDWRLARACCARTQRRVREEDRLRLDQCRTFDRTSDYYRVYLLTFNHGLYRREHAVCILLI